MKLTSLLLTTALITPVSVMADSYTIDPTHTYPNFTINHLGFSNVHGRFGKTEGTLTIDQEKGMGSVSVTVDTASVDTGFKKRDDHLRSPDFFNVNEFPTMTYKSTKVTFNGKSAATVSGDLTLMGVTKPVTLAVDHIHCGPHPMSKKQVCGFNATAKLLRSDFGIKYALPGVGDEVNLELSLEAVKN